MSKQGNKGVVPTLRFPEFQDAGEWIQKPLGKIAKFSSGGTPSKDVIEYWGGDIPWISASSMHETKIEKSELNITEIAVQEGARLVKEGTLLLLVRGSMLHKRIPIGITKTTVAFNQDVKALSPNNDVAEQFLLYFLVSSEYKLLGVVTKTGIGAGKLDSNELNQFIVKFPAHAEQQKIADCLSSIDELIAAHTQKHEVLKAHKKGLMQQLFLAEGETVPKFRFPQFRDAGEWEQKKLKELTNRITKKNREGKVTRVLTNSAVDGIVDQRDYFDKDIANQNNLSGYFIVNEDDYVYNPRISSIAPVGPISKNKIDRGVMSPLYTVFRFKSYNNEFYEQYFKSPHWHQYLRQVSNSGARHDRMSITNDDFNKMPLPAPIPKEQQKIADCLSSLDDLITAHTQKHEALKAHKKGLMQQLFPVQAEQAGESLPEAAQA